MEASKKEVITKEIGGIIYELKFIHVGTSAGYWDWVRRK